MHSCGLTSQRGRLLSLKFVTQKSFKLFCRLIIFFFLLNTSRVIGAGTSVAFNEEGIAIVDGKPFFPIGVFTYALNPEVLAELHELRCNTVLNGFALNQLDLLHEHGLMAVCPVNKDWIVAARNHPALLGWYLSDEPENRGTPPGELRKAYRELKAADARHPIGLCHTSFEALSQYPNACDFTMTDIYPITAQRDKNVMGVSIMMDEARRIHGAGWPQWTCRLGIFAANPPPAGRAGGRPTHAHAAR